MMVQGVTNRLVTGRSHHRPRSKNGRETVQPRWRAGRSTSHPRLADSEPTRQTGEVLPVRRRRRANQRSVSCEAPRRSNRQPGAAAAMPTPRPHQRHAGDRHDQRDHNPVTGDARRASLPSPGSSRITSELTCAGHCSPAISLRLPAGTLGACWPASSGSRAHGEHGHRSALRSAPGPCGPRPAPRPAHRAGDLAVRPGRRQAAPRAARTLPAGPGPRPGG